MKIDVRTDQARPFYEIYGSSTVATSRKDRRSYAGIEDTYEKAETHHTLRLGHCTDFNYKKSMQTVQEITFDERERLQVADAYYYETEKIVKIGETRTDKILHTEQTFRTHTEGTWGYGENGTSSTEVISEEILPATDYVYAGYISRAVTTKTETAYIGKAIRAQHKTLIDRRVGNATFLTTTELRHRAYYQAMDEEKRRTYYARAFGTAMLLDIITRENHNNFCMVLEAGQGEEFWVSEYNTDGKYSNFESVYRYQKGDYVLSDQDNLGQQPYYGHHPVTKLVKCKKIILNNRYETAGKMQSAEWGLNREDDVLFSSTGDDTRQKIDIETITAFAIENGTSRLSKYPNGTYSANVTTLATRTKRTYKLNSYSTITAKFYYSQSTAPRQPMDIADVSLQVTTASNNMPNYQRYHYLFPATFARNVAFDTWAKVAYGASRIVIPPANQWARQVEIQRPHWVSTQSNEMPLSASTYQTWDFSNDVLEHPHYGMSELKAPVFQRFGLQYNPLSVGRVHSNFLTQPEWYFFKGGISDFWTSPLPVKTAFKVEPHSESGMMNQAYIGGFIERHDYTFDIIRLGSTVTETKYPYETSFHTYTISADQFPMGSNMFHKELSAIRLGTRYKGFMQSYKGRVTEYNIGDDGIIAYTDHEFFTDSESPLYDSNGGVIFDLNPRYIAKTDHLVSPALNFTRTMTRHMPYTWYDHIPSLHRKFTIVTDSKELRGFESLLQHDINREMFYKSDEGIFTKRLYANRNRDCPYAVTYNASPKNEAGQIEPFTMFDPSPFKWIVKHLARSDDEARNIYWKTFETMHSFDNADYIVKLKTNTQWFNQNISLYRKPLQFITESKDAYYMHDARMVCVPHHLKNDTTYTNIMRSFMGEEYEGLKFQLVKTAKTTKPQNRENTFVLGAKNYLIDGNVCWVNGIDYPIERVIRDLQAECNEHEQK